MTHLHDNIDSKKALEEDNTRVIEILKNNLESQFTSIQSCIDTFKTTTHGIVKQIDNGLKKYTEENSMVLNSSSSGDIYA